MNSQNNNDLSSNYSCQDFGGCKPKSSQMSQEESTEVEEIFNFTNLIPLKIKTVQKFNDVHYALIKVENYVTKGQYLGYFRTSLVSQFYPKLLIDYYESCLEDNY